MAVAARTAQIMGMVLLGTWGCADSHIVYQPGPTLAPSDLGLPGGAEAPSGYLILEPASSEGRFPTALAVARLGNPAGEGAASLPVVTLGEEQAVRWNSLLDMNPGIRETIVLNERTPGPPLRGLPAIAATARRLNAGLCLVYGAAAAGPDEAALIGALLDTANGQVVAHIQARATPEDHQPKPPDAPEGDLRHLDLEYLATCKFQRFVRECITELITRDTPSPEHRTSPWQEMDKPRED